MANTGGTISPGTPQNDPQPWKPGQQEPPPNATEVSDPESEGEPEEDGPNVRGGRGGRVGPGGQPKKPAAEVKPVKLDNYNIKGYDTSGNVGDMHGAPAPPPQMAQASQAPPDMTFREISVINEEACREVVLNLVAEKCCYGSRPAKNMTMQKITPFTAFHYVLESYAELRTTSNQFRPYKGGPVDGPQCGPAPGPWAIPCQPLHLFDNEIKLIDVPHTSAVRACHTCEKRGWVECDPCSGRGKVRCGWCGGRGYNTRRRKNRTRRVDCGHCTGGRVRCRNCGGDGKVTCPSCAGFKFVTHYIELKVTYKTHEDDYIFENTDLPDRLVREVGGKPVFEQTLPVVWPLTAYPIKAVNENSHRLLALHKETYKLERFLMQRQTLRAVPVTEVDWEWGSDGLKKFWVYGNERKVYFPDYPHQCCWGCVIL